VAKQAAEVDVLSGGRVRLGIGVGWNSVEYEALGVDFATRGSRCDEQIEVLRQLWTEDVVDFHGKYHDITHAGINPLPVQRPIPIWIGAGRGTSPTPPNAAIRRIGRLADGYFPMFAPDTNGHAILDRIRQQATAAGRDPSEVNFEGRITITGDNNPEDWLTELKSWEEIGATHLAAGLRGAASPDAHIDAIRRLKEAMG
jgi:probable F420-dependent oxidoreductase